MSKMNREDRLQNGARQEWAAHCAVLFPGRVTLLGKGRVGATEDRLLLLVQLSAAFTSQKLAKRCGSK